MRLEADRGSGIRSVLLLFCDGQICLKFTVLTINKHIVRWH